MRPARVVVLGAGSVGWNAARLAAAMDAEVLLLDEVAAGLTEAEIEDMARLIRRPVVGRIHAGCRDE